MIPLWVWTALAGLAIGIAYAWWSHRHARKQPIRRLNHAAVTEISGLVERRKYRRAVNLLRAGTGLPIIDARRRIADWDVEAERRAAAS